MARIALFTFAMLVILTSFLSAEEASFDTDICRLIPLRGEMLITERAKLVASWSGKDVELQAAIKAMAPLERAIAEGILFRIRDPKGMADAEAAFEKAMLGWSEPVRILGGRDFGPLAGLILEGSPEWINTQKMDKTYRKLAALRTIPDTTCTLPLLYEISATGWPKPISDDATIHLMSELGDVYTSCAIQTIEYLNVSKSQPYDIPLLLELCEKTPLLGSPMFYGLILCWVDKPFSATDAEKFFPHLAARKAVYLTGGTYSLPNGKSRFIWRAPLPGDTGSKNPDNSHKAFLDWVAQHGWSEAPKTFETPAPPPAKPWPPTPAPTPTPTMRTEYPSSQFDLGLDRLIFLRNEELIKERTRLIKAWSGRVTELEAALPELPPLRRAVAVGLIERIKNPAGVAEMEMAIEKAMIGWANPPVVDMTIKGDPRGGFSPIRAILVVGSNLWKSAMQDPGLYYRVNECVTIPNTSSTYPVLLEMSVSDWPYPVSDTLLLEREKEFGDVFFPVAFSGLDDIALAKYKMDKFEMACSLCSESNALESMIFYCRALTIIRMHNASSEYKQSLAAFKAICAYKITYDKLVYVPKESIGNISLRDRAINIKNPVPSANIDFLEYIKANGWGTPPPRRTVPPLPEEIAPTQTPTLKPMATPTVPPANNVPGKEEKQNTAIYLIAGVVLLLAVVMITMRIRRKG